MERARKGKETEGKKREKGGKLALGGRVVNNTGKKYYNIQYQYQAKKVLPIPIPITP